MSELLLVALVCLVFALLGSEIGERVLAHLMQFKLGCLLPLFLVVYKCKHRG